MSFPTRRDFLGAGLGAGVFGLVPTSVDGAVFRAVRAEQDPSWKLPEDPDPELQSRAENRFWCEILRDHAEFFILLMPGSELSGRRREAEQFRTTFHRRLREVLDMPPGQDGWIAFNRDSIMEARKFADWKLRMRVEQASGRMRSLVWPSFFQAAAREAGSFVKRLERLNQRKPAVLRDEVAELWLGDAADHASMIAQFLDPAETRLIEEAREAAKRFRTLQAQPAGKGGAEDPLMAAAGERHLMEAQIQAAVADGRAHSIIHPLMAEHMVREGLRFIEDLKRAV